MKKLVIIPAYNEQDSIEQTVKNIEEYAPGFDYIVVNDKIDECADELHRLIQARKLRTSQNVPFIDEIRKGIRELAKEAGAEL